MVGYAWYQLHIIYEIIIVAAQRNISTYTIAHSSGLNTKSRKSKKLKKGKFTKYTDTHTEAQNQPSGLVIDRWNWKDRIYWLWRGSGATQAPGHYLNPCCHIGSNSTGHNFYKNYHLWCWMDTMGICISSVDGGVLVHIPMASTTTASIITSYALQAPSPKNDQLETCAYLDHEVPIKLWC